MIYDLLLQNQSSDRHPGDVRNDQHFYGPRPGVVRYISDSVAVMYLGRIMEIGLVEAVFKQPHQPYTEAPLAVVPNLDPGAWQTAVRLSGSVPSALNTPTGCRFHTLCHRRHMLADNSAICEIRSPPSLEINSRHKIACQITPAQVAQIEWAV